MQLEGMQPIGVIEIPAPEQPAFKVGDRVEIIKHWNYKKALEAENALLRQILNRKVAV